MLGIHNSPGLSSFPAIGFFSFSFGWPISSIEMASRELSYTSILALLLCFILGDLSFGEFGPRLCVASDTIKFGQSLSGNQTIVSKGGRFELGFFMPGTSHNFYVGIWYKNIRKRTIVWVANREKPLPDSTSCALRISEASGSLTIVDQSNITIWSSEFKPRGGSNETIAVLQDSGNLVLTDLSSRMVWQSFDHPTNTVLPGAKIGFNRTTGQKWFLTSWRGLEDPAPGNYTLEIDPSGTSQYMMWWNRTHQYWTSGIWDGRIFSLIPEMMALHEFGFQHFSSANANYFTYSDSEANGVSGMLIDVTGRLNFQMWSFETQDWVLFTLLPKDACDVYRFCGSFGVCTPFASPACECLQGFEPQNAKAWASGDQNGGCVRKTALQCGNKSSTGGEKGGFLAVYVESLPINSLALDAQNADECQASCLRDCSCTAYAYKSGCLIWKGDLVNLKKNSKTDGNSANLTILYLHLASSEFISSKRKKIVFHKALLGATAGLVALLCAVVLFLVWNRRRKRHIGLNSMVQGFPVLYRYKDLHNVTKNFSEKLGGGGFGSVYKGTLPDASVIAVKKLEGLRQGEKQFRMEVSTMAVVQHVNIVQLLGFCCEGTKRLLVYEYMDNGSLDSYLFPKKSGKLLEWNQRFQIALGVARGLAYLHERCRECIIHCDVKPENILLDSNFCPKVADFGMAKLMGRDFSRVLTTMRGTIGYLAPEWISGVPITAKADVYSFGMMLFEIVSGRRNGKGFDSDGVNVCGSFFPMWAATNIAEREALILLESKALKSTNSEEFGRACRVACWCIQDSEDNRPSMEQVVQMLEGNLDIGLPPIPRHLQNFIGNEEDIVYKLELYSATASEHLESI